VKRFRGDRPPRRVAGAPLIAEQPGHARRMGLP
jgi:hypothetical protein